jgi:uncharacterized protein YgiB involved in biofilm formation
MPRGSRRRSAHVSLVLLGAAALAGCSSSSDTDHRDVYKSKADCVQDWGDQVKCEPVRDGSYHSSYWYGPSYHGGYWGGTAGRAGSSAVGTTARPGSHAVATHSVSRGGFGSHASAHSSSGG